MNSTRRKQIIKAMNLISEAQSILEAVLEGEQEALDNLPDSVREGIRGERMEEAIAGLESAIGDMENAEAVLEEAKA